MIRRFRIKSIRNKLFLIVMLISGISLLLATIAFAVNDRLTARRTLIYIVSSQANIVGQNATAALTFLDKDAADEVLSGLALQNHIEVARLYNADDQLFAEYSHGSASVSSPVQQLDDKALNFADNYLELYQPVTLDSEQIGTLYVRANLEMLGNRIGNYSRVAFLVFGGLLVLSWLLTSRMHRAISIPVKHIVEVARKVTRHNDYSIRATKITDDELGELVDDINTMLDQIQHRDSQLADYASELEQRVADRTADLEALTEQLRHLAYHDELTGLPNRALFVDRLKKSIAHCERTNSRLAVMFLDLDKFKAINDSLGHDVGDALLKEVAQRIRDSLRKEDSVARLGGDEFTILINDLENIEAAGRIAGKIVTAIGKTISVNGNEIHVSGSIGISIYPEDHHNAGKLMTFADAAMYKAKLDPRNRYHYFMLSLQREVERKQLAKDAFLYAVERGELRLFYEAAIDPVDRSLCRILARVHWISEQFGELAGAEILALIEDSREISAINTWVIQTAGDQLATWQQSGLKTVPLVISLSRKQLEDSSLATLVRETIDTRKLAHSDLVIEIDNGVLGKNGLRMGKFLETAKTVGLSLSVNIFEPDDCGLVDFLNPCVTSINLDKALTMDCGDNDIRKDTVKSIVKLCHHLGIKVIAGGIGSARDFKTMATLGCDQLHGKYISTPGPATTFAQMYLGIKP